MDIELTSVISELQGVNMCDLMQTDVLQSCSSSDQFRLQASGPLQLLIADFQAFDQLLSGQRSQKPVKCAEITGNRLAYKIKACAFDTSLSY